MSIFENYGPFLFPSDEKDKSEEEAKQEEERIQEQLCELMYMQQQYHGIIKEQRYVLRDSKLCCQYGTRYARLDCIEDNGILKRRFPVLTVFDCTTENIHSFGSCLCPEANYAGRLPMAVASNSREGIAVQADCNIFPHICVPIISGEDRWKQIDGDLLVETNAQGYASMLTDNAVLVCQYGGIISIVEVPDAEEEEDIAQYGFQYDWKKGGLRSTEYVTQEFLDKVISISNELQINPDDLMAVMAFESWIDPYNENSVGAYGLIQFTAVAIAEINRRNGTDYTMEDVKNMDAMEQLELVYLHFKPKAGLMNSLADVYLAVFAPAYVDGTEKDDNTVLYSIEDSPKAYYANSGLDTEKKGYITRADACAAVIKRRDEYYLFEE